MTVEARTLFEDHLDISNRTPPDSWFREFLLLLNQDHLRLGLAACSGVDAEFGSFEAALKVDHDAGESIDSSEDSDDMDVQAQVMITEEELWH